MNKIGTLSPFLLASRTISKVDVTVTPFFRACVFAFCMVGPSAMGSVNGKPSSIRSTIPKQHVLAIEWSHLPAPPDSIPSSISTVSAVVGYPAVT